MSTCRTTRPPTPVDDSMAAPHAASEALNPRHAAPASAAGRPSSGSKLQHARDIHPRDSTRDEERGKDHHEEGDAHEEQRLEWDDERERHERLEGFAAGARPGHPSASVQRGHARAEPDEAPDDDDGQGLTEIGRASG